MPAPSAQQNSVAPQEEGPTKGLPDASARQVSLEKRLNRIVQRILDGLCVPFLGAGISLSSPTPNGDTPTINAGEIAKNLAQRLFEHLPPATGAVDWLQNLRKLGLDCARLDDTGQPKLDKNTLKQWPFTPSLGEVAELCWSVLTPAGTCEVLKVERWNERFPTAAHHYISVLVREGLITEVLGTNYDEFVERAVQETFGKSTDSNELCAPVISDLDSYRKHIASPRDIRKQHALVKVVKLNGCAAAYRRDTKAAGALSDKLERAAALDNAARRIVLTEEQLQSWGDKHWARELLNDRVRSRTLLFIGFGNADPIVRHHSVQVIREFQAHAATAGHNLKESKQQPEVNAWSEHNNAPFVAAFDPNLSFYQYQVLRAFRDAHSLSVPAQESSESNRELDHRSRLEHVASVYENTFLGSDGPLLLPQLKREGAREHLPADSLLQVITTRCLCRLVSERWFDPESPLYSYLQGALRHPRTLLAELRQALLSGDLDQPPLFSEWLSLKNPSRLEQASSPWSSACFAIRGQEAGRAGYRPFLESPIKQPMLLVLMALASLRDDLGQLKLPSGDELLARASAPSNNTPSVASTERLAAYRLVDPDHQQGGRAVFATSHVDTFLYGETGNPRVVNYDDLLPDHSIVIGLGRGNIGAFRRQIWFEIRPPTEVSFRASDSPIPLSEGLSAGTDEPHPVPTTDFNTSIRVVREIYVVGDLAVIRGSGSRAVDLPQAHENLRMLAQTPEILLGNDDDWHRYCLEAT